MALLEVRNLTASYNNVPAMYIDEILLEEGELVAILGPNGVGKTTTLSSISRTVDTTGTIIFDGEDVSALRPVDMVRRGVIHAPEGRKLFADMSVQDNLR